jgi:hypothetical protein
VNIREITGRAAGFLSPGLELLVFCMFLRKNLQKSEPDLNVKTITNHFDADILC